VYGSSPILSYSVSEEIRGGSRWRYVHYRHGIVVEDCRYIFRRKFVGGIADKETRLSNGTVTNHNTSVGRIRQ
jgi:hypothetical protein